MPANGSVQIAFDRVLDPATVNRQAAVVVEVGGHLVGNPLVAYDPVRRVLSLSNPTPTADAWLTVGRPYELVLTSPNDPDSAGGVQAVDGAALDENQARVLPFFAGPAANVSDEAARGFEPVVEFCRDVLPVFQGKCAGGACHSAPSATTPSERFPDGLTQPAEGLVLDTAEGVANTALKRVSQEANRGSRSGRGLSPGRVFGIDMPIIEPGNAGSSWLVYKLIMAVPSDANAGAGADGGSASVLTRRRCDGNPGPAPVSLPLPLAPFVPISDAERTRLSDSMLGSAMPYPLVVATSSSAYENSSVDDPNRAGNLTSDELSRVRAWIAQGAVVSECGACLP